MKKKSTLGVVLLRQNPCGIGVKRQKYFQRTGEPLHEHLGHELVFVKDGSGIHHAGGVDHSVRRGDVFLVPFGMTHSYRELRSFDIVNVLFDPEKVPLPREGLENCDGYKLLFAPLDSADLRVGYLHLNDEVRNTAARLLDEMEIEWKLSQPGWQAVLSGMFQQLAVLLSRGSSGPNRVSYPGMIQEINSILTGIREHYREPLRASAIARQAHMPLRTMQRLFKKTVGVPPERYLFEVRMKNAQDQLVNSDFQIQEIARNCGFPDSNCFAKLFRREYGLSPREYRNRNRKIYHPGSGLD